MQFDGTTLCSLTNVSTDPTKFYVQHPKTDNDEPVQPCDASHISCQVPLWLISLGFSLVFGTIFAKTYRVYKIFNNPKLRKVRIKNSELFKIIIFFLLWDVLLLTIWYLVDPLILRREWIFNEIKENMVLHHTRDTCSSNSSVFYTILLVYKVIYSLYIYTYIYIYIPNLEYRMLLKVHILGNSNDFRCLYVS